MKRFLWSLVFIFLYTTASYADCGAGQPPAGTVCAAPAGAAGPGNFRALADGHIPSSINAAKIGGGSVSTTEYNRIDGITAYGQSLISVADEAALKALTNLEIGTDVQAFDADLTTWAGLTPSANAQSLVTAASYAAMRALLDLEAGVDFYSISAANAAFQPLDSDLTTWAGLTPSANAQSLVTAANYAAMRTLLDLEAGVDFYSIAGADAAFQPLDADLTTWAGVTSSANGRSLVSAANYAAMRGLLDLEVGTDFNAFSSRLADIAGITWNQGDILYYNGSNLIDLGPGTAGQFLKTQGAGANPVWDDAPGAGGGATVFTELGDVPPAYTGAGGSCVKVNATEDGLEFDTCATGGGGMDDFTLAGDAGTPQTIADGNILTIAGGTGIDTTAGSTDTLTINLDSASIASLALADSAVQNLDDLGITASAAELNTLDGITSSTAELNILDGVTSTAAELNILDGATLDVTELNFVDGVTSGIQTQINGKQAADADLTTWAGLTPSANAQSLVTAANYAAMRALLDLEAGTDFYSIAGADAAFQPLDADLTSWAGVTRASGFDTFVTTPSSANQRALLTDESGTGADYFQGGDLGTPSAGVLTNATGLPISGLVASTSTAIGVGSIELGHATNTTIGRPSAGDISVEGNIVYRLGGQNVAIADGGCNADDAATCFANIKQAASLTATGVSELATDAEAQAKSDTARVLTPSNLAALGTSTTFAGLCELATTAEVVTGTDTARCVTPEGVKFKTESLCIAASDESTNITTGTNKVRFRMPYAFTLASVRASVNTAPVGSTIIIDINEGGSTIMTTNKLSIDASETTSTTAATAAGLTDTSIADDAQIGIDFDQVGSSTAGNGVKVCLIGHQT